MPGNGRCSVLRGKTLLAPAALAGLLAVLVCASGLPGQKPAVSPGLEDALRKASAGKCRDAAPPNQGREGSEGHGRLPGSWLSAAPEYAGHADLPNGHWVYVAPYWYIWRDLKGAAKARRAWGPERHQVAGLDIAPDPVTAGVRHVRGDVRDRAAVELAMRDADVVVHCVAALPSYPTAQIHSITVKVPGRCSRRRSA